MGQIHTLTGRTALLTGASSGIGRAIAIALAEQGASLVLLGRRLDALDATAALTGALTEGQTVTCRAGDLRDPAFVVQSIAAPDRLDILICSAGVVVPAPFLESDPQDWRAMLDTNVLASMIAIQGAARRMRDGGTGGHVVLIGSALSSRPMPDAVAYAACKAAVHMLGRGLRQELARHGIRVTEVSPGLVGDTDFKRHNTAGPLAATFDTRPYAPIRSADVARAVLFALNSPPGVSLDFVEVMPEGQF